jgi:UDP-N-acetylglucosamine 2-epimerase (non-hydrolysing)/GDP/UDP-N,N'-diacetylbacillosamine 2-epimerase (hydrolysing)
MTQRKVCVVTGSRAEYGLFYPVLKEIERRKSLDLQLVATTMHLSEAFGLTYKQIESDGFILSEKIDNLPKIDSNTAMAKSSGKAITLLSDCFDRLQPDVVLLLGDRFETHSAATTALLMNIPIAHIHGGEITEGSVDEQIRHSITKMSYLHFCATEVYRKRILQMGEDSLRIFNTGAPGIDNIINLDLLAKSDLEKFIEWKFPKIFALFTYHSETLDDDNLDKKLEKIFTDLQHSELGVLFTYANADYGGRAINDKIEKFCELNRNKYKVVKSLGQLKYLSSMKYCDLLIGNTSSGIIEAASFNKPVVNIGKRQLGRLRGDNVIDCNFDKLEESIKLALSRDFQIKCSNSKNIYGDGKSAIRIVDVLAKHSLSVVKKFVDN